VNTANAARIILYIIEKHVRKLNNCNSKSI